MENVTLSEVCPIVLVAVSTKVNVFPPGSELGANERTLELVEVRTISDVRANSVVPIFAVHRRVSRVPVTFDLISNLTLGLNSSNERGRI